MARITKADLELQVANLEKECREVHRVNDVQGRELTQLHRHITTQNNYISSLKEEIQIGRAHV